MFKVIRAISKLTRINKRYCTCEWQEFEDANTKIAILPNGVRVATEETCSPLACISLFVEAGSRFESASINGITHFIEHMAFKGFGSMSRRQFEQTLLHIGSKLHVETTRELQIFTAYCPAECASNILDIYSKIICDLELNETCIDKERSIVCDEMEDADNDPRVLTFDYLHQCAFQGTPLAQRVIGPSCNLARFDKDLICSFMLEHYQPYKLCLATCGGVCHENMLSETERRFGNIVPNPEYMTDEGPCRFTGSQVVYRNDSMPFAHVAIGFEVPGYGHEDYLPLLLMSCMTGSWCKSQQGAMHQGSPLAIAAAHDNCHYFDSFYLHYKDVGLWGVYYVGERMQLDDMMYNIQQQWMYMCTMTNARDLERAINLAKLKLCKKAAGVVECSHDIGYQMMYTCGRRSVANFKYWMTTMEPKIIRNTAYKYLYDKCPAVAAVGPTECLPDYTRIRAGQYWLRV
ncbi:cytochrome b-c1 complex subunit 1, mitochondrial-like [Manduca sexta]|uniref:Mitochondrial processing peptidase beta subunit n=1 Tax=Manduca sexta TaxID=7130 RepID=A0A921YXD1_MANSE|nr:cytochrome b-c1 complex subunit 1, mitochondrial-like [Manduca sexta]KAG6446955.1 hypothetical protein O3G_MSEX004680 [Manduca sexta]